MSDCGNNISDYVISAILPRIRITWITGGDTVVLPPYGNSPAPMPHTAICCLLPHENIPYESTDIRIDGKLHHTRSGDCLIFPEGCRRWFYRNDAGHRSIWAHFRIRLEPDLPLLNFFQVPGVIRGDAALRCRSLLERINRGRRSLLAGDTVKVLADCPPGTLSEKLEDQALSILLLKEVLEHSVPRETLSLVAGGFRELENAMEWIRKHKFEKLTLDDLARCCHCSKSAFEKKFHRVFGVSPGKYLLNLRLSETEDMLRNTTDSCAKIAEKTGFANQFVFSRLFKQRCGISPRDYRNRKIFC